MNYEELKKIIEEKLIGHPKCYNHCQEQSRLEFLSERSMLVGCYVCPSGYVSRIVTYGTELNLATFKTMISGALNEMGGVSDEDIRVATRYTWDLGIHGKPEGTALKEAYWTQNYRRTKSEDPNRPALFLCTKCNSLFHQSVAGKNTVCPRCKN